jgi:glycosyltransferase involved in cell wall biosynthesis
VRLLALDLGPAMRGGQRQTALVLAGLASRGHEIRLLARRGSPLGSAARTPGLDVIQMPPGSDASPALLIAVARAARSFRSDVVYAGDARGHGAAVFSRAAASAPLVVHRRVIFPPGQDPLSRLKYRAAARYLAISRAVAASLEQAGVPAAKVTVVPDGLPDEAFLENAAPAAPPFRFVHAGAFDGLKGQDVVVETLARLVVGGLDATALFLGDGPRRGAVEAQAAARGVAGRCVFAGHVEDVASRLAASHVLLLPSDSEGGPLALVEAMAAGCLAVGHEVGGASEMVLGGTAGVLVASLDPEAWKQAVLTLLHDPARRARLVAAGHAAARERTIARTVAGVEAELEKTRAERSA